MINSDVISMMPTIFMAIAITSAISSMKIRRARSGCMPSASASSTLTVPASSGRHSQAMMPTTMIPPIQTIATSVGVTARMSPKRKAMRSNRTQVMKATMTRPIASVAWLRMPSSASADSPWRFCRTIRISETSAATTKTLTIRLSEKNSDSATPSNAEWAMVSPK